MAGRGITTRELIDPDVNALDVRTTRAQFTPQIARFAARDFESPAALRVTLQTIADQQAQIAAELSTLPFLGGVYIANKTIVAGVGNLISHGIDGEVDVMVTLPSTSSLVSITSQDSATRTLFLTATVDCVVSVLIFPKKRGV